MNAQTGAGTAAFAGGNLKAIVTSSASGAGSPANLQSYPVVAGTVPAVASGVHFLAWGVAANNANAKTVSVTFAGTTLITQGLQASVNDTWALEGWILDASATSANSIANGLTNGTTAKTVTSQLGFAVTWANANTLQVSCTQVAAGDVTEQGLIVDYIRGQ